MKINDSSLIIISLQIVLLPEYMPWIKAKINENIFLT